MCTTSDIRSATVDYLNKCNLADPNLMTKLLTEHGVNNCTNENPIVYNLNDNTHILTTSAFGLLNGFLESINVERVYFDCLENYANEERVVLRFY